MSSKLKLGIPLSILSICSNCFPIICIIFSMSRYSICFFVFFRYSDKESFWTASIVNVYVLLFVLCIISFGRGQLLISTSDENEK